MTWTTLHDKAQQLGFELVCHTRAGEGGGCIAELSSPPQNDGSWVCIGSYGHMAGLWAQPLTAQARALTPDRIAAMISDCCRHVETIADHDEEFQAHLARMSSAIAHSDHGRMPA